MHTHGNLTASGFGGHPTHRHKGPSARGSPRSYRYDPLMVPSIESVGHRNSMSIQSILNPSDDDNAHDSRTPSLSPLFTTGVPRLPEAAHRLDVAVPNPAPCDSGDDRSSRASSVQARARPFRPAYDEEESLFIWYHRYDLQMNWVNVEVAFNRMWPGDPRKIGGLQCKLYRFLESKGLPRARKMKQGPEKARLYGMAANTHRWFPWMETRADRLHSESWFCNSLDVRYVHALTV